LHRTAGEFTAGFRQSVGGVETRGPVSGVTTCFSISPEIHRRVLENQAAGEVLQTERDWHPFHFSALNDGNYGLIEYLKPVNRL